MVKEFDEGIKAELPEGIWQEEPDYQHWVDEETGLDCLIVRHPNSGHLCGYVGVSKEHPWFGVNYNECSLPESRPLGRRQLGRKIRKMTRWQQKSFGYTRERAIKTSKWMFRHDETRKRCLDGDWCEHSPESHIRVHGGLTYSAECHGRICHKTDNGDHVWWFGFDCAHGGDKCHLTKRYDSINLQFSDLHEGDVYRDVNYVMAECKDLAKQLKEYDSRRIIK